MLQINVDFEYMYPDKCDNLVSSLDSFYRDRILAIVMQESTEMIKKLIDEFQIHPVRALPH